MKRIFACLLMIEVIFMLFPASIKASQSIPDMNNGRSFFSEAFSDKRIFNNTVIDKYGKTIWQINTAEGQTNAITDTGALELGNARYMQRAVLADDLWGGRRDYAMEFTINVQKLGNEGRFGRPVAIIIPRSMDKDFTKYYAVTYYMENTVANQFKFKWAVINTAAPSKMEPLVEGYYLLRENVDYTARLVIQNTTDGNVNIKFYIDGPVNPVKEYKPLLEYTDNTQYKITSSVTGPALGMVGYAEDTWGTSPVVRYDNIKLYDINEYEKNEKILKENALVNPDDIVSNSAYGEIKYLLNRGAMDVYPDNSFKPGDYVSVAKFIKALVALKNEACPQGWPYGDGYFIVMAKELKIIEENEFTDYNSPITRYDAALLIERFDGNQTWYSGYTPFIRDYSDVPFKYLRAVAYAYYKGCIPLNNDFNFMGTDIISRADASTMLLRLIDSGFKKSNYKLELPSILSSGAVLQGNKRIPVWGRGTSGDTITVFFNNQVKTTVVRNGNWYTELDPMPYGGPYTLTVIGKNESIVLDDIMVGEVYIVAGQSNAEMFLSDCNNGENTLNKYKDKPNLRFFSGEQITAVTPNFTNTANWEHSYDWVLNTSPAIGTFFADKLLDLNKELSNVTIGIVSMTYGGTSIEAFMPGSAAKNEGYVPKDDKPIMSGFWNGFMEPITPFAVRGVIYYQGENSAHLGYGYEPLLRDYLQGLRTEFNDPNLPVMLVQLAGYGYNNYQSDVDEWPVIREVQMKVANTTSNTGLVTAVDLSDTDPIQIHPKEKEEIGRRLAYMAMGLIYGKEIQQRSAELKNYKFEGSKVIVGFNYDFGKLYFKDNTPKDFQVLDAQGKWHMANTVINNENNTVEIWSDDIPQPMGVRYAWVNYPNISLYNNVGLPVLPFKIITVAKTSDNVVKSKNHMLETNDAIVNKDRGNIFRVVIIIDKNTITHEYPIKGQTAGDTIARLSRSGNSITVDGTGETIVKICNHGLSVGDWIRNDTRGWEARRVEKVLDENTIEVAAVKGQCAGDEVETYKFIGDALAE